MDDSIYFLADYSIWNISYYYQPQENRGSRYNPFESFEEVIDYFDSPPKAVNLFVSVGRFILTNGSLSLSSFIDDFHIYGGMSIENFKIPDDDYDENSFTIIEIYEPKRDINNDLVPFIEMKNGDIENGRGESNEGSGGVKGNRRPCHVLSRIKVIPTKIDFHDNRKTNGTYKGNSIAIYIYNLDLILFRVSILSTKGNN